MATADEGTDGKDSGSADGARKPFWEPEHIGGIEGEALIGVISDTHGLLRDSALEALRGVDRIIHAGDIDEARILKRLEELAPVTAVRGNVDRGPWAADLPRTEVVEMGTRAFYLLHDPERLDLDPAAAGFDAVIHGHTHDPRNEVIDGVLYLNPGSAGRHRRGHPVTLALLRIPGDGAGGAAPLSVDFVALD